MPQREGVYVMAVSKPLEHCEPRRHYLLDAARMQPAGHDDRNSHVRLVSTIAWYSATVFFAIALQLNSRSNRDRTDACCASRSPEHMLSRAAANAAASPVAQRAPASP